MKSSSIIVLCGHYQVEASNLKIFHGQIRFAASKCQLIVRQLFAG